MYEQFTDRSREVMRLAEQEAQKLYQEYIGTDHILLGLALEESGIAAYVLKTFGFTIEKIKIEIDQRTQKGFYKEITSKLPFTPRSKKVIEYSIQEAQKLNNNYIGTEHLLLGLIKEEGGIAFDIIKDSLDEIKEETLSLLGINERQINIGKMANIPTIDQIIDQKIQICKKEIIEEIIKIMKIKCF